MEFHFLIVVRSHPLKKIVSASLKLHTYVDINQSFKPNVIYPKQKCTSGSHAFWDEVLDVVVSTNCC